MESVARENLFIILHMCFSLLNAIIKGGKIKQIKLREHLKFICIDMTNTLTTINSWSNAAGGEKPRKNVCRQKIEHVDLNAFFKNQ